ncbi:MAG: choice-of-anchor D domain-containing protein [Acidobacteria bacterium]|nr:choice-of-anchor D domain-containing protein [Acidobacteriota bacterium]
MSKAIRRFSYRSAARMWMVACSTGCILRKRNAVGSAARARRSWLVVFAVGIALFSASYAETVTYTYDANGQLTKADYGNGTTIAYTYDAAGNLVAVNATGTSRQQFYFPFYQGGATGFTGFAFSNYSDKPASLEFSAFGASGNPLPFPRNPASFLLQPRQQLARAGSEIFSVDPSTAQAGWIRMESDNPQIASFFQFGTNDLSQLDGSLALDRQAKKFYFTRVFQGSNAFRGQPVNTFVSVANPNDQTITIKLNLYGSQAGATLAPEQVRTIPAKGFLYQSVPQIFGQGLSVNSGYITVEVTEGDGAAGFELIQLTAQNTVIGLNASPGNGSSNSYSAQLASDANAIFTSLKLINVAGRQRTVTLRALGENGSDLATPVNRVLEAGQVLEQDVGPLFGLPAGAASVGSLRAEANGDGVIGDVIFGDPTTFNYAAALPLQTQPLTRAIFSQVVNLPPLFTGLALYNPGTTAAQVTIEVFSAQGALIDQAGLTIRAGERVSKLVSQFAPSTAGQAGGYVSLRSTEPVIAQQLFGNYGLTFLSAVPPTIVATTAGSDPPANIEVTPASLDFGSVGVGQSKDLTVTLRNAGAAALTVNSISSTSPQFSAPSPATPFTLAAGGQQAVTVRFTPASSGAQTGSLTIAASGSIGKVVVVSGTGASSAATPPSISAATVTKVTDDSVKIDIQIADSEGDIARIDYSFSRSGVPQSTRTIRSPADINLAGFTTGTVSQTFTGMAIATPFGTLFPDKVEIEATDAKGLKSNAFSKAF